MATNKARIEQLEKRKGGAAEDNTIRVFITDEDGGAVGSNGVTYTAAEYAEYKKQCAARGEKFIHIRPEDKEGDE